MEELSARVESFLEGSSALVQKVLASAARESQKRSNHFYRVTILSLVAVAIALLVTLDFQSSWLQSRVFAGFDHLGMFLAVLDHIEIGTRADPARLALPEIVL